MKQRTVKAFTIVEFSLALAFIATLLVAISVLIMRVSTTYQKGLTMRGLNAASKEINERLSQGIKNDSTTYADPAIMSYSTSPDYVKSLMYANYYSSYSKRIDGSSGAYPQYGAFCTGTRTYIWNTPYSKNGVQISIHDESTDTTTVPRFAEISDYGCLIYKDQYLSFRNVGNGGTIEVKQAPNDLLQDSEVDLYIYSFKVFPAFSSASVGLNSGKKVIYNISYVIGTKEGGIDVLSSDNYCKTTSTQLDKDNYSGAGTEYCAVNKFDLTIFGGNK